MSAIGPGDWVICIDGDSGFGCWLPGEGITTGAIYQVADCFEDGLDGTPCITLVGRDRPKSSAIYGFRLGFCLSRFRLAFDGDESTLRKTDEPVKEDA